MGEAVRMPLLPRLLILLLAMLVLVIVVWGMVLGLTDAIWAARARLRSLKMPSSQPSSGMQVVPAGQKAHARAGAFRRAYVCVTILLVWG